MKLAIAYIAMISCTVAANLLLKVGGGAQGFSDHPIWRVWNWPVIFGLISFGLAGLVYMLILRVLPLNVAVSITAAQFIAVVLAAWLILGEPITPYRWVGIVLIFFGVLIVGRSVP